MNECDICNRPAEGVFIVMELDERLDLCSYHYNDFNNRWRGFRRRNKENKVSIKEVRKRFETIKKSGGGYY